MSLGNWELGTASGDPRGTLEAMSGFVQGRDKRGGSSCYLISAMSSRDHLWLHPLCSSHCVWPLYNLFPSVAEVRFGPVFP
jgi:hypothetical protein